MSLGHYVWPRINASHDGYADLGVLEASGRLPESILPTQISDIISRPLFEDGRFGCARADCLHIA